MWLIIVKVRSLLLYGKLFAGFVLKVATSFLFDPTLQSSKPLLQKLLPYIYMHPCHSWDLGLVTICEVVSPNYHALNI